MTRRTIAASEREPAGAVEQIARVAATEAVRDLRRFGVTEGTRSRLATDEEMAAAVLAAVIPLLRAGRGACEPLMHVSDACDLAAAAVSAVLDTDALEAARVAGARSERERIRRAIPGEPDLTDAFDDWLDESDHNMLLMSIGDEAWRDIARQAALTAWAQGAAAERDRWKPLLDEALHLLRHGECAPGGTETWGDWAAKAEALLRADLLAGDAP